MALCLINNEQSKGLHGGTVDTEDGENILQCLCGYDFKKEWISAVHPPLLPRLAEM
jgi:hypothetical protein